MLSILDLLRRMDAGELTPEGAVRLSREAIAAADDDIGAFVTVDHAATIRREGALRGIATGVKDIIDTADLPTEMGSPIYAGWRPKADAPIVSALKRAGATVIGKTATTPFAYLDPTVTRNPANHEHTPGGSSSGSAAVSPPGWCRSPSARRPADRSSGPPRSAAWPASNHPTASCRTWG